MIQSAKIIGTGLATTDLIESSVGIVLFGALILGVAIALMMSFLLLLVALDGIKSLQLLWEDLTPPNPHSFTSLSLKSYVLEIVSQIVHIQDIYEDIKSILEDIADCCDIKIISESEQEIYDTWTSCIDSTDSYQYIADLPETKSNYISDFFKSVYSDLPSFSQDFGKMWPNSTYAMDSALLASINSDIIVMINNDVVTGVPVEETHNEALLNDALRTNPEFSRLYDQFNTAIELYNSAYGSLNDWFTTWGSRTSSRARMMRNNANEVEVFWDDILHWSEDGSTREEVITNLNTWSDNYLNSIDSINAHIATWENSYPEYLWYIDRIDWPTHRIFLHGAAEYVFNQIEGIKAIIDKLGELIRHLP